MRRWDQLNRGIEAVQCKMSKGRLIKHGRRFKSWVMESTGPIFRRGGGSRATGRFLLTINRDTVESLSNGV